MSKQEFSELIEAQLYAEKHHLLRSSTGRAISLCLRQGIQDAFVVEELQRRVHAHRLKQAFAGPFELPRLDNGNELRGYDLNGRPVLTPVQWRNHHTIRHAATGGGKTTSAMYTALELASQVKTLWLIDMKKREWRHILPTLSHKSSIAIPTIRLHSSPWNPLQLEDDTNPVAGALGVAVSLEQALELPGGSSRLLHSGLLRLYRNHGILNGNTKNYPTIYDLCHEVADDKNANAQSRLAFLRAIQPILYELGPKVLGFHFAWPTKSLACQSLHFEFTGVSETCKTLKLAHLLLSECNRRISAGISNPHLDLYVSIDEAGSSISASRPNAALLEAFPLVRGTGIGLDVGTTTADIHHLILSNCGNKLLGRCNSSRDYDLLSGAMGCSHEQRQFMPHELRTGVFVEQVSDGKWRYPYLVQIPKPKLLSHTEQTVSSNCLSWLPVIKASVPPEFDDAEISTDISKRDDEAISRAISDVEQRFLQAVVEHPGKPSSLYVKLARIGGNHAKRIRTNLVAKGYLREHSLATGNRGRTSIVLEPLKPALQAVAATNGQANGVTR